MDTSQWFVLLDGKDAAVATEYGEQGSLAVTVDSVEQEDGSFLEVFDDL